MNSRQYVSWASPILGRRRSAAGRFFLSLAQRWESAGGPGHFLETSIHSGRGLDRLKLALILEAPPELLAVDPRRDEAKKASAAEETLRGLNSLGGRYDAACAREGIKLLHGWGLRGSLMMSLDFERGDSFFGKLSLYAYLGPGGIPGHAPPAGEVAFWGLDLSRDGRHSVKFYQKTPYRSSDLPPELRPLADRLQALGPIRDITRLTREGAGREGKLYLGFRDGLDLAALARARLFPRHSGLLAEVASRAEDQKAYFIGFEGDEIEIYFDRRGAALESGEAKADLSLI